MAKPVSDNMIKLIVTDLDNTALLPDKSVSPRVAAAFAACGKKGIRTAVATARAYARNAHLLDELGVDCAVVNDGTVVYKDGHIVYDAPLDKSAVPGIIGEIVEAGELREITVITEKDFYWNRPNAPTEPHINYHLVDFNRPFELDEPVYKVLAVLSGREVAERIASHYDCRLQCYRDEPLYAFVSRRSGKMIGIRELCRSLGITTDNVAAFGDDLNDIEMLLSCGQGIAVANAIPATMEAADFVAPSNAEDGVAVYIEEHFLSK